MSGRRERGCFGVALWTVRCLELKGKVRAGSEEFVVTLPEAIHVFREKSIGRREDEGRNPEGRQHVAASQRSCPLRQRGRNSRRGLARTRGSSGCPGTGGQRVSRGCAWHCQMQQGGPVRTHQSCPSGSYCRQQVRFDLPGCGAAP